MDLKFVATRLRPEQYLVLERFARQEQTTVADVLRRALRRFFSEEDVTDSRSDVA